MVAAFPVFKLGALMIKQISKPLANLAKNRAKQNPFFRNYICMPPAQFYHWCEVKLKMWTLNLGKPVNIPKLTESSAIELGAELVGEALIFSVASGILIFEYVRQTRKEAVKEAERIAQMERIQTDLKTLYTQNSFQQAQIRELIRVLEEKMPDSNFLPEPANEFTIPEHHRHDVNHQQMEELPTTYSTVKGWIFNAIDFVLPPGSDNTAESQQKQRIVIIKSNKPQTDEKDDNGNVKQSSSEKKTESGSDSKPSPSK